VKPKPEPLPEPTTRDEAQALVWAFLKRRLAARRAHPAGIGETANILHRLPGPDGYSLDQSWPADVPLGGNWTTLLGGLLHAWPGSLKQRPSTFPLILDVVHDLQRQGILRPSWDDSNALFITHHGAAVLDRDNIDLPAGDTARVERLRSEFAGLPDLDLIARHYAEAIAAYAASLDYSATVMIGVCYEAGLLLLAREIAAYESRVPGQVPGINKHHRPVLPRVAAGDYVRASSLEALVYDVLCAIGEGLGGDLEWVKTCLRPTCHFVRSLRNKAGHPTGKAVPRDDIAAHILMLPAFLRRVRSIGETLRGLP